MSLDTYGFIADCDCCIKDGLSKMEHPPASEEGIKEAQESFGDLWEKYAEDYLYYAKRAA